MVAGCGAGRWRGEEGREGSSEKGEGVEKNRLAVTP